MAQHIIYIIFLFLLGSCVGSFLNVVVWRLPRVEPVEGESTFRYLFRAWQALSWPPSHCPKCGNTLKWYDNLPIVGWIKLGGKCRFCREPISSRYPIVEAVAALLFVFYYVMFYLAEISPCPPVPTLAPPMFSGAQATPIYIPPTYPMLGLCLFLIAALLAASLIDAELFIIPAPIPWVVAALGVLLHTLIDEPRRAGALNLVGSANGPSPLAAMSAGGIVGLVLSITLWKRGVLPLSFPQGEPLLEVDRAAVAEEIENAKEEGRDAPQLPPDYTRAQIRAEIGKEMLFLLPPMVLAVLWLVLTARVPPLRSAWGSLLNHNWATALLGSIWGGLIGAAVVWLTRILGTLGFGRVAMGLGDVDLMFAVGTVLGAGAAAVAFFLAPFFGIVIALYMIATGTRRELPYGPYLSLASGFAILFYCPIANWLAPGVTGLGYFLHGLFGGGG